MWQGFIGQTIAKKNQRLLRTGVVFLVITLAAAGLCSRWMYNVWGGPFPIDEKALAAINPSAFQLHEYVRVSGQEPQSTGVTEQTTETENGRQISQWTSGEFMVLRVGEHLLLVKAPPHTGATTYSGALQPIPADLNDRVMGGLDAETKAAFLPVMLNAADPYDDSFYLALAGVGLLVLITGWILFTWQRRSSDFARHPLAKNIARFGALEQLVPQIDGEMASGPMDCGAMIFLTKSWLVAHGSNNVMRKEDILWAYKKQVKRSVNGVPTGTTYASIIKDAGGKTIEVASSEKQVHALLNVFLQTMPWMIVGYDAKLEQAYAKDRAGFVNTVRERRKQYDAQRAAAAKAGS